MKLMSVQEIENYENEKGIPNVILNDGEYCVIEADESDGSIEKYNPYINSCSGGCSWIILLLSSICLYINFLQ